MSKTSKKQYVYETIAKCECYDINATKLEVLKELKHWMRKEVQRCLKLFIKGCSYKYVYRSFNKEVNCKYKAKIACIAAREYLEWCKKFNIAPKHPNLFKFGRDSLNWVYKDCIEYFSVVNDYTKRFQLKTVLQLPFAFEELNGKDTIALVAGVPRKFWKQDLDKRLYKEGFILKIEEDIVRIHLVSKEEVKPKHSTKVKAVYASPNGNLHTASMTDLNLTNNKKDYYEAICGSSLMSKEHKKLIERIRSCEHKATYNEDLKKLELKCKTRANKYFKKHNQDHTRIVFVNVVDNNSKIADFIQNIYKKQFEKLCKKSNTSMMTINVSQKSLDKNATLCMRHNERKEVYENKARIDNSFKAVAALRLIFSPQNVRIGVKQFTKQIGKFSEKASTYIMRCADSLIEQYNVNDACAAGFV